MNCYFCKKPMIMDELEYKEWEYCAQCPLLRNWGIIFSSRCSHLYDVHNVSGGKIFLAFSEIRKRLVIDYVSNSIIIQLFGDLNTAPQIPLAYPYENGLRLLELNSDVLQNKIQTWTTFS
jgi:hypothetical protein